MRKEVILTTLGLRAGYGGKPVLQGLEIEVRESEIVAVIGRNGVGKSTLMKSLIGLVPAMSGSIVYRGEAVEQLPAHKRARLGMGYVPQGRDVFPRLTVGENMAVGAAIKGGGIPEEGRRRVVDAFPILQERWSQRAGTMSGGQQQQLAIARALATKPKVLLLDEPTEGIQPSIIKEMARTLKRIRDEKGLSIVVSEQVLSFALDIADRVLVIENGEIVRDDPRDQVDAAQVSKYLSV